MARTWRQNVIVSHGGRHGRASKTYRRGTAVTPEHTKVIPDSVLGAVTEHGPAPLPGTKGAILPPRLPEPGDGPEIRKLLEAAREQHSQPADPLADKTPQEKAAVLEAAKAKDEAEKAEKAEWAAEKAAAAKAENPPEDPPKGPTAEELLATLTSKRKVRLIRKADLETVAAHLGIQLSEDVEHRTRTLREMVAAKLDF